MVKTAVIGALALLVLGVPARADWRTPIQGGEPILSPVFTPAHHPTGRLLPIPGAEPILPPRFQSMGYAVIGPAVAPILSPGFVAPIALPSPAPKPSQIMTGEVVPSPLASATTSWSLPLVDRRLTLEQRTADLAPELEEAVLRIEPMYDPTRIDGPDAEIEMSVSAGTAAMDNVFADHWRLATPDANINLKTSPIATAWQATGVLPCDAFAKNRPHGYGDPSLTALSADDCGRLLQTEARRYDETPPTPVVTAKVSVPVFAAPLPGSRMSSQDFWAAQKARIQAIQSHLHDKWQTDRERVSEAGLRP